MFEGKKHTSLRDSRSKRDWKGYGLHHRDERELILETNIRKDKNIKGFDRDFFVDRGVGTVGEKFSFH